MDEQKPANSETENKEPKPESTPPTLGLDATPPAEPVNIPPVNTITPPSTPSVQPASSPATSNQEHVPVSHNAAPGIIVLQWLTYAFWGWAILALSSMIVNVLLFFVGDNDTGSGFTPFGIAALLVLLPLSAALDFFYTKKEPAKKTGSSAIVMVIHAVLFALFGIGAFIAGVFTLVMMFTNPSEDSDQQVALLSSLIIAVLYGAVFLRTLNPAKLRKVTRFFTPLMTAIIGIVILLSIVGPVMRERATKTDRIIERGISQLSQEISNEAAIMNELPENLSALDLNGDAKKLVDDNLVTYKPDTQEPTTRASAYSRISGLTDSAKTFYYELCVTYKGKSRSYGEYDYSRQNNSTYQTYISAYSHPAGEVCYKIKTGY